MHHYHHHCHSTTTTTTTTTTIMTLHQITIVKISQPSLSSHNCHSARFRLFPSRSLSANKPYFILPRIPFRYSHFPPIICPMPRLPIADYLPSIFCVYCSTTDCEPKSDCVEKGGFCANSCPDENKEEGLCFGTDCVCCLLPKCKPADTCAELGGFCAKTCPSGTLEEEKCDGDCKCCIPERE
ncbi:hypothetical protein E2C01_012504 [Portunus trituberculatus]|uniref:Uncharacterized protein n=1 Tax=Portunus trituberculatus TaxID=210409 RepID=A0A5B7DES1_PORTR|nr:hypothetical protein [Portunus trituberculatus]